MAFDFTNITNVTDYVGLLNYVNFDLTGMWFGNLLLISIFGMLFIGFKTSFNYDTSAVIGASMFITTILSILLRIMEFVPDFTVYMSILFTGLSAVYLIWAT
tara:strand:+ start:6379 stop:6684 length:306 start_codon:yes stop_codon:yes gene_type:complete